MKKDKKENKESKKIKTGYYFDYRDKLNDEYRMTFDKIEDYCKMQFVDSAELNDSMNYLMDVFLNAQADGLPVQKITGGDIGNFCKCFLSDISIKGRISAFLEKSRLMAGIFLVLTLFMYILPPVAEGNGLWEILSSESGESYGVFYGMVMGLIFSMILDGVAHAIVKQMIFKAKKYRKAYNAIVNLLVYTVGIASLWLIPDFEIDVPGVPLGVAPLMCIVWLVICILVKGFINVANGKPFFHKAEKTGENQLSFRSNVMRGMVEESRKDFKKKNEKLQKKGKPTLTQEQYIEKFYKNTKKSRICTWICTVSMAVFYIGIIIDVGMDSTPLDTAIFAAILVVLYIIIMYPLGIYPYLMRKRFQEVMDESGKTFFDDDIFEYFN